MEKGKINVYEIWYGDLLICSTNDKDEADFYWEMGYSVRDYSK